MKITQIREKEDAEALSVLDFDLLMEKIKTETKTRPGDRTTPSPAFCFARRALQLCRKAS